MAKPKPAPPARDHGNAQSFTNDINTLYGNDINANLKKDNSLAERAAKAAAQQEKEHPHDPSTCPPNPDTAVPIDYKAPDYYPDDINYEPNYVTVTAGMIVTCIGPTGPQGNKGK